MSLTPEQKTALASWVAAGDGLSVVQKKLSEQFQVSMTYRDVRFLLDQGRFLPATDYINAQRARRVFRDQFLELFRQVDLIFTPATPTAAAPISDHDDGFRLATTRFARAINLLGFPALSMPCGFNGNHMPLGLQIIAAPFEERQLLAVAAALEDETDFHKQSPPL